MGKTKRGHNAIARQVTDVKIDRTEEEKISLDLGDVNPNDYDESNPLVLPSEKRKTEAADKDAPTIKKLSKKQRKKLEKIIEQKKKKVKRVDILASLAKVQASAEELNMFTSTSEMQSNRPKRILELEETGGGHIKINAISGSNKRRRTASVSKPEESESSSSEESSEEEEEEENDELSAEDEPMKDSSSEETKVSVKDISKTNSEMQATEQENKKNETDVPLRKVVHIPLNRSPEIQEQRLRLPILGEEQIIMEAINENPVVILCGETGSGKTTQVPQFLYEAGYAHGNGIIGVTEPRRVAAISMSQRIGQEMNLSTDIVSYQIRYEGNVTDKTKVKFMTDGVLLKEVQKDFMLTKYSVIIIDEAHERSVYTDILIGLLSRIVPLRNKKGNPLKLIIMSATLRVEDFTENTRLFKSVPPVIKVESRQFPVTIHFNKRTPVEDYLGDTYNKICKIHRELPEGGILVFVTGQQEVHTLCAKLRATFPHRESVANKLGKDEEDDPYVPKLPKVNLDDYSVVPMDEEAEMHTDDQDAKLGDSDSDGDDEEMGNIPVDKKSGEQPLHVLPLYSLLASRKQAMVFKPPPDGTRLCVVSTNVSETSLTIPNVKYVVDTGKVKTKFYDKVTGVTTFKVTWTSKASSNQRAGRAGRTAPGHCYRLYSSAVFNDDFEKFAPPEITRRPVEDLVLQMKDMSIDKVTNFPFPTPPDADSLKAAERLLISLGALQKTSTSKRLKQAKKEEGSSKITPLGRAMAAFPVAPRYGKMLSLGHQHDLLPYVVAIVAALSVQELFVENNSLPTSDEEKASLKIRQQKLLQSKRTWAGTGNSKMLGDLMVLLKAVGAAEYEGCDPLFCQEHGIRHKAIVEVRKLRAQLTNAVNAVIPDAGLIMDPKMPPPGDLQAKLLRQIVLAGLADHIAKRMPDPLPGSEDAKKLKNAYQTLILEEPVFIHPNSVMYKQKFDFLVYQHVDETSKLYLKGVSAVEPEWLPLFVPNLCQFSKPSEDPAPRFHEESGNVVCHMTSNFGPHYWSIPAVEVEYPMGLDRLKLFAKFFLEGSIYPKLKKYASVLLSTPATMIKTWSNLQPRTEVFLKALISEAVDSREKLEAVWTKDPSYLLKAYCEWLPQALQEEASRNWPPLPTR